MPSDTEISTMEIFIEVLKPVVEIMEVIDSKKSEPFQKSDHLVEYLSDTFLAKTLNV